MSNWKHGRKILLGITGGIAAYKIPALIRLITKSENECEIIMTQSAKNFAAPMTIETLSGRKIWDDENFDGRIPHVNLTHWAEVLVIAPCTANTLAKISHGIADNLLTSAALAAKCPMLICPAMNENMYNNPATQQNISVLKSRGVKIIEPSSGELACGDSGKGRMIEPHEIMHEIFRALCVQDTRSGGLQPHMAGKNVLVTAGPTHEYIDPVRYISNPSTGKMGAAMARGAWYMGANVRIIAGPADIDCYGMTVIRVKSAREMLEAVRENLSWADYVVKAAAVGDYRVKEFSPQKLKREGRDTLTLELVQNPDISAEVGRLKRVGQILVGFAAETENIAGNAREKLARKNLDYILANDVAGKNTGFASDTNILRLFSRKGEEETFSGLKEDIASDIWSFLVS